MQKRPLYSRSGKARAEARSPWIASDGITPVYIAGAGETASPTLRERARLWADTAYTRHRGKALVGACALVCLVIVGGYALLWPPPRALTQGRLNQAVNFALDHRPEQPSVSTLAYAQIIPSVVRIDGYDPMMPNESGSPDDRSHPNDPNAPLEGNSALPGYKNVSVGGGVVIDDKGSVLTAMHVAVSAKRLRVIFADGTQANATIAAADKQDDMAQLKPDKIPDDLQPATLSSTRGLRPGDEVEAVGFPFGIGPSVSAGVVSGLKREFEGGGKTRLSNLIQFDAAANPGNSGGPLVDRHGEVIGIVDAIVNPSGARTFAGIGFAVPIENAMRGTFGESPL
ncbi:S1C family serine protease [Labrys okinawensis]|uniref:S1C family serine protease n=1 Tax=Labrys okinawensis TaxID=346911 RepID=UPI0039BC5E80